MITSEHPPRIVIQPPKRSWNGRGGKGETLEVVDGQQRLATTAILLAAFRDHLRDNNEDVLVESINNEFLTSIDRSSRARVPNLKLNVDDNDLFRRVVVS